MLEKLVSEERHTKLARFHPSSEDIFVDNESFDYVTNEVLNTENTEGWKKVGLRGLNGLTHAGYGLLEGVSRITESGLRLAGSAIERSGKAFDEYVQSIRTDQYDGGVNTIKVGSRNIRNTYTDFKEGFQGLFSPRSRNKMMVGLALIVGLNAGYKMLPNIESQQEEVTVVEPRPLPPSPRPPQPLPPRPQPSQIPVNNISSFNDRNVLIYCANDDERISVGDTLRSRGVRLRGRDGVFRTRFNGSNVDVVVNGSEIPRSNYGVIQLRGHTGDMIPLSQAVGNRGSRNHLLVLGGCNSAGYIGSLASPNRPVIGSDGTQDSSQNTYLLGQILRNIGNTRSWSDLSGNIKSQSMRARNETTFPGDQNYMR